MKNKLLNSKIVTQTVIKFDIKSFFDKRGIVNKPIYKDILSKIKSDYPNFQIKEIFFTYSLKDVIRGMHFTTPSKDNCKLIYLVHGEIDDVVLSLVEPFEENSSLIFNKLDSENPRLIFIPPNYAHGYRVISNFAIVMYITNYDYSVDSETSINPMSIPYDWNIEKPILSDRDENSISYNDFLIRND